MRGDGSRGTGGLEKMKERSGGVEEGTDEDGEDDDDARLGLVT